MFFTFLKGIIFGIANIIPGVSGGTIAVVLKIFDTILNSINSFLKKPKESLLFLLPFALGIGVGILFFSSIIDYGLTYYSFPTSMFFAGLVAGSISFIWKIASKDKYKQSKKSFNLNFIFTIIAFAVVLYMSVSTNTGSIVNTSNSFVYLIVCGAVASSAMIIPGVSGSFITIMLGIYSDLINAISNLKFWITDMGNTEILMESLNILIPIAIGIVIGIFLTAKIISFLLEKYESQTYFTILGLILASLIGLFINPLTYLSGFSVLLLVFGVIAFAIGFYIASLFSKG
ncbi:MAG: DUF368 domain-containing protein [Lachnospirales bacterium]